MAPEEDAWPPQTCQKLLQNERGDCEAEVESEIEVATATEAETVAWVCVDTGSGSLRFHPRRSGWGDRRPASRCADPWRCDFETLLQ